jgi:hypothetical protein
MDRLVLDSITKLPDGIAGRVVLAASHGGLFPAMCALKARLGAVLLHDAGIGRGQAGIGGVRKLGALGVPAAAIAHRSARIGDGADCLARGVLSFVNAPAAALGLASGQSAAAALAALEGAALPILDAVIEAREARATVPDLPGVVVADSVTLVSAADRDAIFVTGSHGGLLGGRPESAIRLPVFAVLYSDADRGMDDAGISRLPALDARGIAAATVSVWSALIGDSRSTLEDGVITHCNERAQALGGEPGLAARELVLRLIEARERAKP